MREAIRRLLELGLTEKEAYIYVAMLELGPTSVQEVAKKSKVNRTTVYNSLKDLQRRGLMSCIEQGSKILYIAESPVSLKLFLEHQGHELKKRQKKMEESLPFFMALYNSLARKPRVRYFEGPDGMSEIREIMMDSRGEYLSFTAIDEMSLEYSNAVNEGQRKRMARRMHGKYMYALKSGCIHPEVDLRSWEVRKIPYEDTPCNGEINIVDHKVGVYTFSRIGIMGFIVESAERADLFRALFQTAWRSATPVNLK